MFFPIVEMGVDVLPERSKGKTTLLNEERGKHSPEGYFSGSPKYFHDTRYRVSQTYFTFLNWLKMAVKCVSHIKSRLYYHKKDPPFDIKHYLMSTDPFPIVKININ